MKQKCISLFCVDQKEILTKNQLFALLLGQYLSLLITGTGVCSQLLAVTHKVNIPTTQSTFNYLLLFVFYFVWKLKNDGLKQTFQEFISLEKLKVYVPLALFDVEANYLVVKAYQYTTISSIMLLDCFAIPCAVLFTWMFLRVKYNLRHLLGILLCISGLVVLVYSDLDSDNSSNKLLGDILCLCGSLLYAITNVATEATVKKFNRVDYLFFLGFWASVISGIQLAIAERHELEAVQWNWTVIALLAGYAICLFLMYSLVPLALVLGGAALFNLGLLTSDMFAILAAIFLFGASLSYLFFISLVLVIIGLAIYNIKNEPLTRPEKELHPCMALVNKIPYLRNRFKDEPEKEGEEKFLE